MTTDVSTFAQAALALGPPLVIITAVMGWASQEWRASILITLGSCAVTAVFVGWIYLVVG